MLNGYRHFSEEIEAGTIKAFTCGLSLTETTTKPIQNNNTARKEAFIQAITRSPRLTCLPVTNKTFIEAAHLRATTSAKTPDAIHLAAAITANCDAFLTNDQRIAAHPQIEHILLAELI